MRDQILNIAIQQMKSGGYENLNFATIAAGLGITRANIHHHFKNKEGLGIAATENYIHNEKTAIDAIFQKHDGDIRTILKMLEDHLIEIVTISGSTNSCILSQLIHDSEAPEVLRKLALERSQEEQILIKNQIEKAKKSGMLENAIDAERLSFRVMATMFGITQMALVQPDKSKLVKGIRGSLVSILG